MRPRGPAVLIAGVDEAGRGPLAGPVVAAAVILPRPDAIDGLADSKLLSPQERGRLAPIITERAVAWGVAWADSAEIDSLNILQATFLAMRRALMRLAVAPTHIQVDGNRLPRIADLGFACTIEAIVAGDASEPPISAASILAKTTRDMLMEQLDARYPGYDLSTHKGYPTPQHLAALRVLGPSPLHRRSFAPLKWQT
jgi:ribonuclease HII